LSFKPKNAAALDVMKTKELNNGRLAMIGVAGVVAQELVTSQSIF
jgi:light-harvesting complex I chlorophyll a/b binding protein 1